MSLMSTATMNISLPESLKRFVKERTKSADYSNPSDYIRALIRDDQRRHAAEKLLEELLVKHERANPGADKAALGKLKRDYWRRWAELTHEIDQGLASLGRGGGRAFDQNSADEIKQRGRLRLAQSKSA